MRLIILSAMVLSFSLPVAAQQIKVRKIKGNQAVVEIQNGNLRQGQTYNLTRDLYTDGAFSPESRLNVFGLSLTLASTKSDASNANSSTSIQGKLRYGWNKETIEYGLLGSVSYVNDSTTVQTLKGGAFFDYNLLPNISGEIFIYGLSLQALMGQYETSGTSLSLIDFYGTGFIKWFPKGGTAGLRLDGGFVMQNASGTTSSTTTGFLLEASLIGYF